LLRGLAGFALILFVGAYYGIGMLFILGSTDSTPEYGRAFGVHGMFGIAGPPIVLGAYLLFIDGASGLVARRAMLWALIATQVFALYGMVPMLGDAAARADAEGVILSGLFSTILFGWPIVRAWLRGLMFGPDGR